MNLKLFLVTCFCSTVMFSQEQKYLNNDTRLYIEANSESEFIGYFRVNAQVQLISKYNDNWYFVKADNDNTGYIQTQYLSDMYTSNTNLTEDLENPILRADQYYGNYHLFINVASLRVRGLPNATGPIVGKLTTGEAVSVKYIPKDTEDWVSISNGRFIQRKYLSERPDFNILIQQFESFEIDNIDDRKKIAERILQLSWNSDFENLYKAFDIYYQVVKQLDDDALIENTKMNLILAKGLHTKKSFEEIEAYIVDAQIKTKGLDVNGLQVSHTNLVANYGMPEKIELIGDECGIYLSDTFYNYPNMQLSVDVENNIAEFVNMIFNKDNAFVLNDNAVINYTTTELEFVTKYSQYLDVNYKFPHTYTFIYDSGGYQLFFQNGKLYSLGIFNLC